jgi:hypothetical protein
MGHRHPNSMETWKRLVDSGMLSERQLEVANGVAKWAPITVKDCLADLRAAGSTIPWNSYTRFTELERGGVIKRVGVAYCPETNSPNDLWALTGLIPVTKVRRIKDPKSVSKPKPEAIKKAVIEIQTAVGDNASDELRYLLRWLQWVSRKRDKKKDAELPRIKAAVTELVRVRDLL